MCWNSDVSLNTFVFVVCSLVFLYLSNTYTKYKLKEFQNPLIYLLLFLVAAMQLVEFFLWKNLSNKSLNTLLSKAACSLVVLQLLTLIFMIPAERSRNMFLFCFMLYFILKWLFKTIFRPPTHWSTTVGSNGHLSWDWMNYTGIYSGFIVAFLFMYVAALILVGFPALSVVSISFLAVSAFYYFKHNTFGTMWCWAVNFLLLYYVLQILIVQPLYEYKSLC